MPIGRLSDHEVRLILAFAAYYRQEPALINDLVTGAYLWPPAEPLNCLAQRGRWLIDDITYLRGMGLAPGSGPRLCQLYAATTVLERMEEEAKVTVSWPLATAADVVTVDNKERRA